MKNINGNFQNVASQEIYYQGESKMKLPKNFFMGNMNTIKNKSRYKGFNKPKNNIE